MTSTHSNGSHQAPAIWQEVNRLLERSPSFQNLDAPTRTELAQSMAKIAGFLAADVENPPLARQFAPDLQQRLSPQGRPSSSSAPGQPTPGQPAPAQGAAPTPGPASGTTGRAGEVARATLNAIDFPAFVASLIQGTFQAIVDSSIQQMEAYAELLKNVAGTVDRFMDDNISDGTARDYLADQYGGLMSRDTSGGQPRLRVNRHRQQNADIPSFFKDLGFGSADDIDDDAIEQVIVPATRRHLAERRQQTLATMVLMGINRVVVDDGEITAKLQFHIDASETTNIRFDQTKTTAGNMTGYAGRSPFSAQAVMVNTANMNAQSDINVRADLTGQVRVKFRSETFPLERFADSAAIQLINANAKVPQQASSPAAGGVAPAAATPVPVADTPAPAPRPAASPTPPVIPAGLGAQSVDDGFDPWAPEV
jgi:hypothetical protein